jgi:hypothetical protein
MKKYYKKLTRKGTSYKQKEEGRITELVTCRIGYAFYNRLLKRRQKEG